MKLLLSDMEDYYKIVYGGSGVVDAVSNHDEAGRWAKVSEYLRRISEQHVQRDQPMRILDVGCGRGWLTNLASIYGHCDGVDPVAAPVRLAQQRFPDLKFSVGTAGDVIKSPDFQPYDVIVAPEVIEHTTEKRVRLRARGVFGQQWSCNHHNSPGRTI